MEKLGWKITAIVFICLFAGLLAFNVWGYSLVVAEEAAINECYYNTCEEYPQADYNSGLCICYDYDIYGDYEIVKTEYNNP